MGDGSYYVFGRDHITIDMSQYVSGGDTAAILIAHTIHHMDAEDNELWRWNSFDHYYILDVDEAIDLTNHTIDWTHCNSIEIDADGNLIISTRNLNEVTKISRQTGEIIALFNFAIIISSFNHSLHLNNLFTIIKRIYIGCVEWKIIVLYF